MKAMIYSDFTLAKPYFLQQSVICILAALLFCFSTGTIYSAIPIIACIGTLSIVFNLIALDESNAWERFRISLPLSRKQIIQGRYASSLLFTLCYTLFALVFFFLLVVGIQLFGSALPIDETLVVEAKGLSWQLVLALTLVPIILMLAFIALVLPFSSRFGMTKALRFIPLAAIAFVFGGSLAFNASGIELSSGFASDILNWIVTPEGTIIASLVVLTIMCTLYLLSYFIANRLYAAREF